MSDKKSPLSITNVTLRMLERFLEQGDHQLSIAKARSFGFLEKIRAQLEKDGWIKIQNQVIKATPELIAWIKQKTSKSK